MNKEVPHLTLPMPKERLLALAVAFGKYADEAEKAGATHAEIWTYAATISVLMLGQVNDGE